MEEYYQYYTLDYMAEKGIRIKPKDEEEAKQVIAYLYKAGYRWRAGSKEDTFYKTYGDKTSYRIYPNKVIFYSYSDELENCIAPQQITGIEDGNNVCSFNKFVKKQTQTQIQTQTQTNTIKEEKGMLDLVKIYKERKEAQIKNNARIAKDKALDKDPTIKALKDLQAKSKRSDGSDVFTYALCDTSDSLEKEYEKITENAVKETRELNALIDEVNAQLGLCETYDQKIAILKGYGILDESGRINA